jgi:SAM-dependent methyltransferase
MNVPIDQHNVEIHDNALRWRHKPLLRKVYAGFYRMIARCLRRDLGGLTVEIGAGIGNLKSEFPDSIATDVFPNPWLDRVENAYALSFADGSVSNLILFDVWHHLQYPGAALEEFARVLRAGGRVILFEPAMGWLGRVIYGRFHHEPLGYDEPIEWFPPPGVSAAEGGYYAAQANASRIFFSRDYAEQLAGWKVLHKRRLPALYYVGSGGFRGPQLYPTFLYPVLRALDRVVGLMPALFATRMLVVLEKR